MSTTQVHTGSSKKVVTLGQLLEHLTAARGQGNTVVFTAGCFDVVHAAHVDLLEEAKQQGDVLVVGVTADAQVRQAKGLSRPVFSVDERSRVLAGLSSVDYVVKYDEPTPVTIVQAIKPDVCVKGKDWQGSGKPIPEKNLVRRWGGTFMFLGRASTKTTTTIVRDWVHREGAKELRNVA